LTEDIKSVFRQLCLKSIIKQAQFFWPIVLVTGLWNMVKW